MLIAIAYLSKHNLSIGLLLSIVYLISNVSVTGSVGLGGGETAIWPMNQRLPYTCDCVRPSNAIEGTHTCSCKENIHYWTLITTLNRGDPINNPWNGTKHFEVLKNIEHAIYFDEGISNYDFTGNTTITLHGNPVVNEDGLNLVGNQWMTFDTNYEGTHSMAFWLKLSPGNPSYMGLFVSHDDYFRLLRATNDSLYLQQWVGGSSVLGYISYTPNKWLHIVFVIESNNSAKLYLNGNNIANNTSSGWDAENKNFNGKQTIGKWDYNSRTMKGIIKSVNIGKDL
jgi:hypothetical protein